MISNGVIQIVASVTQLDSKLLNIEIIKFYKSILKSKDPAYFQMIIQKNLFWPVVQIFELTYRERNPPMIQSTIRDLFEHIFRPTYGKMQITQNELYNQKLVDHLTKYNTDNKAVIFNPKYKDIFEKYNLRSDGLSEDGNGECIIDRFATQANAAGSDDGIADGGMIYDSPISALSDNPFVE